MSPTTLHVVHDWTIELPDGTRTTARAHDKAQAERIALRKRPDQTAAIDCYIDNPRPNQGGRER